MTVVDDRLSLRLLGAEFIALYENRRSFQAVDSIERADGIWFLCPKCFQKNGGDKGTHMVICWSPEVPADVEPKPGRWFLKGTSIDDVTLVAGSSSIKLNGGCSAHFWINGGRITGLT